MLEGWAFLLGFVQRIAFRLIGIEIEKTVFIGAQTAQVVLPFSGG